MSSLQFPLNKILEQEVQMGNELTASMFMRRYIIHKMSHVSSQMPRMLITGETQM